MFPFAISNIFPDGFDAISEDLGVARTKLHDWRMFYTSSLPKWTSRKRRSICEW